MIKLRYLLLMLILPLVMAAVGAQHTYIAVKNPQVRVMSCASYLKQRPDDVWLQLRGCELSVADAAFSGIGSAWKAFVPIKAPGQESSTTHLVLQTRDAKILALLNEMIKQDKLPEKQLEAWVMANYERMTMRRDIDGLILFGVDADSDTREQLEQLQGDLAPDYRILKEGDRPLVLSYSLYLLIAGLALLGIFTWLGLRAIRARHF